MNFGDMVGQSALTEGLLRQMRSGQVVHAYLFVGERGTGKRTLAGICARALVCEGEDKPCDKCGSCQRALTGNHPDIQLITPGWYKSSGSDSRGEKKSDKEKKTKSLSVDDVRALTEFLSRRPYEAGRNIAIIPDAQDMTTQAQNALLKTLETPPGQSVIFMVCSNAQAMLPTITSRCRVIKFEPLGSDIVRDYLTAHGVSPERAHLIASISRGSIGVALDMDKNDEYWNVRNVTLDALGALKSTADIASFSFKLKDMREHADWILDSLEIYARDLMLFGGSQALNIDRQAQLEVQAKTLNGLNMLRGIIGARERLKSNLGWLSVLDMICFDALEE